MSYTEDTQEYSSGPLSDKYKQDALNYYQARQYFKYKRPLDIIKEINECDR